MLRRALARLGRALDLACLFDLPDGIPIGGRGVDLFVEMAASLRVALSVFTQVAALVLV